MKTLAIIGASYLQEPLVRKAKDYGCLYHLLCMIYIIEHNFKEYGYIYSITYLQR